jgi:preprotein translocase subunit SecD
MRRHGLLPLLFIVVLAFGLAGATIAGGNSPELGLDLQGGVSVVLEPEEGASSEALSQTIQIIRTRVDALGVAEPEITRQGNAIVVQLPGVKNQRRALEIVGQTAELRFRPVLNAFPLAGATTSTTAPAASTSSSTSSTAAGDSSTSSTAAATSSTEQGFAGFGLAEGESAAGFRGPQQETTTTTAGSTTTTAGSTTTSSGSTTTTVASSDDLCPIPEPEQDDPTQPVLVPELDDEGQAETCYQLGPSLLTGAALSTASAEIDPGSGQWLVRPTFRGGANGIQLFNSAATECFNATQTCPTRLLAIVLDGVVVSAPEIQQGEFERDSIQITGAFSEREAKNLALVLRYGALPVRLEPQTVQTISASLGRDSLNAGIAAGIGGLVLVALYMVFYYRALGLVVIAGLAVWSALNYSIISYLSDSSGLALSLAGVTGIIVSVGVTVDSYVVYFERLKDELRAGRTLRSSTDRAFRRAFRTILAADISSFIGASLLYWLTVGPVRGFAFFLGLSTMLDVVVAWFFTRPVVGLLSRNRMFTDARFLGITRGLGGAAPSTAPAGGGR